MNEYRYRNHIKILRNVGVGILIAFSLILFTIMLLVSIEDQSLIPLLILPILMLVEGVFVWFFMGRFLKVKIAIDESNIIYTNHKGEAIIKFEDIEEIKFSSIKYLGGWMKIKTKDEQIRFTVVIKNVGQLLLDIKIHLDNKGIKSIYKEKGFTNFLKTSIYADESWDRLYGIWWKVVIITIITTVASIIIGSYSHLDDGQKFLLLLFSYIYPTIIYTITEVYFMIKNSKLYKEEIKKYLKETSNMKRVYTKI